MCCRRERAVIERSSRRHPLARLVSCLAARPIRAGWDATRGAKRLSKVHTRQGKARSEWAGELVLEW